MMNRRSFFSLPAVSEASKTPVRGDSSRVPAQVTPPLNISAGLEPLNAPLSEMQAAHLLRRTAFGVDRSRLSSIVGRNSSEVVDEIVDEAISLGLPAPPVWFDSPPPNPATNPTEYQQYLEDNFTWGLEYRFEWAKEMYTLGFREKMTLFWHDHLVTSLGNYVLAPFAYQYLTTLRTHGLGDFKQLVYDIGIDPGMLVYLNGTQNEAGAPNENYAREVLELFTMGQVRADQTVNYTQSDIENIARALTGWKTDFFGLTSVFNPFPGTYFDDGEKTFLGRTGNFGYDDVVNIIFEERADAIAEFMARKFYQEFVYPGADETIVSALGSDFSGNGFNVAPTLKLLLSSAHFFDQEVIGAKIKSPIELAIGLLVEATTSIPDDRFDLAVRASFVLEQYLLNPPSVQGWAPNSTETQRSWINTSSFPIRWFIPDLSFAGLSGTDLIDLVGLAETLHDPFDILGAFRLPEKLCQHFFAIKVDELDIQESDEDFAGDLVANPIPEDILNGPPHVLHLAKLFLSGSPWYEWSTSQEGANVRIILFLRAILQLPEFQLT